MSLNKMKPMGQMSPTGKMAPTGNMSPVESLKRKVFSDRATLDKPQPNKVQGAVTDWDARRSKTDMSRSMRDAARDAKEQQKEPPADVKAIVPTPLHRSDLSFYPIVKEERENSYMSYTTPGRVVDILTETGWDPTLDNMTIVDIDTTYLNQFDLIELSIVPDQFVALYFETDEFGAVKSDPKPYLDVYTEVPESLQYRPPVGEDLTGAPGYVYVKIFQFVLENGAIKLIHHNSGQDYVHHRDRPPILKVLADVGPPEVVAATGLDIFKHYNLKLGIYEYFGLRAESPLSIVKDGSDLLWKFTDTIGADLDLTIYEFEFVREFENIPVTIDAPATSTITTTAAGKHTHTLTWADSPGDGGHGHAVTATQSGGGGTGIPVSVTLSGSTATDGVHSHSIADHYHDIVGGGATYYARLDASTLGPSRTGPYSSGYTDDGEHSHSVSGTYSGTFNLSAHTHDITWPTTADGKHVHSVTVSEEDDHTDDVTLPAMSVSVPTYKMEIVTASGKVYCWRAGKFINEYAVGATLPDLTDDVPHVARTIYVWDGKPFPVPEP